MVFPLKASHSSISPTSAPPLLYLLPKMHKSNNPGCPIVPSHHSTECVSTFLDSHVQPFVQSLPSYIKDTNHFLIILCFIPNPLPSPPLNTLLSIIDVVLYSNIPPSQDLATLEKFLYRSPTSRTPTPFLLSLIHLIFTHSNFSFNSFHYLQV